jgi:hypothetical protein
MNIIYMDLVKSVMKLMPKTLKSHHIFFILMGVLLLGNLGYGVKEYFENGSTDAQSALPKGVPRSEIPEGDEDLYILKSEIVPPVCPRCPEVNVCDKKEHEKCPPCPACARCPEPSFECKKVPTYRPNDPTMPRPVLSDFSQFGM